MTARASDGRSPARLAREERTLSAMVALYCRDHHADRPRAEAAAPEAATAGAAPDAAAAGAPEAAQGERLCEECAALLAYALRRLKACRYGADKPTCANCPTHCYKPAMREEVREVMRYSGPRMMKRHPVLAVAHLLDGRKQAPGAVDRRPGGGKSAGDA